MPRSRLTRVMSSRCCARVAGRVWGFTLFQQACDCAALLTEAPAGAALDVDQGGVIKVGFGIWALWLGSVLAISVQA